MLKDLIPLRKFQLPVSQLGLLLLNLNSTSAIVILCAQFSHANSTESFRRATFDGVIRYIGTRRWSLRQHLAFAGAQDTSQAYDAWVRKHRADTLTDEVEGGKLHWIGRRVYERVLVYVHGECATDRRMCGDVDFRLTSECPHGQT